mgnify:CR=1 FL=1
MLDLNCEMIDYYLISKIVEDSIQSYTGFMESSIIEKKRKGNYNQSGKNNNNYKNGISMYQKRRKSRCERCGSTKNLMVHHKDHNRSNNEPSNLETLCWSCHEKITSRK